MLDLKAADRGEDVARLGQALVRPLVAAAVDQPDIRQPTIVADVTSPPPGKVARGFDGAGR